MMESRRALGCQSGLLALVEAALPPVDVVLGSFFVSPSSSREAAMVGCIFKLFLVCVVALCRVFRTKACPPLGWRICCESLWFVSRFRGGRCNVFTLMFVLMLVFVPYLVRVPLLFL